MKYGLSPIRTPTKKKSAGVKNFLSPDFSIVQAFLYEDKDEEDSDDEYDDEDDKAYAELPRQTSAPAAYISPEMVEAMQRFPQWSQEDIQGYFDQGWDINSLQEWVDSQ